jgi:hypothetical protein
LIGEEKREAMLSRFNTGAVGSAEEKAERPAMRFGIAEPAARKLVPPRAMSLVAALAMPWRLGCAGGFNTSAVWLRDNREDHDALYIIAASANG